MPTSPSDFVLPGVSMGVDFLSGIMGNIGRGREAKRNRQWAAAMRGSQWQAAVHDMEAAGINPALAYSQGGNALPSAPMAQVENVGEGSVANAMAVKQAQKNLELLDAQIFKTTEEARVAQSEQQMRLIDKAFKQSEYSYYFRSDGTPSPQLLNVLENQYAGKLAASGMQVSQLESLKLSLPEQRAVARIFDSIGAPGKAGQMGWQMILPLLTTFLRNNR